MYKLTVMAVKALKKPGYYNDGSGLYLRVTKSGTKSWIFRFRDRTTRKVRDMGLGSLRDLSLAEARDAAGEARKIVRSGADPITERQLERAERRLKVESMFTFDQAAERYVAMVVEPVSKNSKHLEQWKNTLRTYASPVMGALPVAAIDTYHILSVLDPIWHTKTETACRLRARIEKVLDWARARKHREGPNPARWRGHMQVLLVAPNKIKRVRHFASLPYARLPELIVEIRGRSGHAARCLEFTILTATRTGESTGVQWHEVDLDRAVWTIPASRMKTQREHRVPLSSAAVDILKGQQGQHEHLVFPSKKGRHLPRMAMLDLLNNLDTAYEDGDGRPITVHGFRSSFRTWAAEMTAFPRDICEASLAHVTKSRSEAAYNHSDLLEKRAELMNAWATYINNEAEGAAKQQKTPTAITWIPRYSDDLTVTSKKETP